MADLVKELSKLTDAVKSETNMTVQAGPFKSMKLLEDTSWYGGDLLTKLLGVYEAELQLSIEIFAGYSPDVVINIGCGEGYYAVGLSRLLPSCSVYAIDCDEKALDICRRTSEINGVSYRVRFERTQGRLSPIEGLLKNAAKPFLFVDCEGCEREIFLTGSVAPLSNALIITECHDHVHDSISEQIVETLRPTHECRLISQGMRNPHNIPLLRESPEPLKWLAMTENRPRTMNWVVAQPRSK